MGFLGGKKHQLSNARQVINSRKTSFLFFLKLLILCGYCRSGLVCSCYAVDTPRALTDSSNLSLFYQPAAGGNTLLWISCLWLIHFWMESSYVPRWLHSKWIWLIWYMLCIKLIACSGKQFILSCMSLLRRLDVAN